MSLRLSAWSLSTYPNAKDTYPNAYTAHIQTPIQHISKRLSASSFSHDVCTYFVFRGLVGRFCMRAKVTNARVPRARMYGIHVMYCMCGVHVMYCMCGIRLYAIAMVYMWCIACVVYICMPLQVKDLTDRRMSTSEKTWQMQGCLDLTHASVSTLHTTWHMQAYLQCTWLDTCKRVQTWHRQPCHRCNHVYTRKRQACHVKATKSTVDAMPWWRMQRVHLVSIGDQGHI